MSENNCSNYGVPEAEQACQQFVETVVNDPDSTGRPHITRSSLSQFGGSPLSPLHLQLAYSTTKSSNQQFWHIMDSTNGCMMLLIMKLGNLSRFQETHTNTNFMFSVDRSPIRFDTSERHGTTDAMDLRLLSAAKQAAHQELYEALSRYGSIQLIYGRDNFHSFSTDS